MNFWLLLFVFNTVMVIILLMAVVMLDKKCWDMLGVIKGMAKHIEVLEEKIGLVHSDIQ